MSKDMTMHFMTSASFPSLGMPSICTPPYRKLAFEAKPAGLNKTKTHAERRHTPNKETRETIEKALRGEDVYGPFKTYKEMMAFLDA
ncbi:hypothetical protein [Turicimonas sp. TL08]